MPASVSTRRFTVGEYYRMAEVGILRPGERVELIEGEIIAMAAIGSRHAATVDRLVRLFIQAAGDNAHVRGQNPVRLSDLSEPEPDIALLRPRIDDYTESHPGAADVLLIIEVADTTVGFDRGTKAPLYALAGIAEYWLVDLQSNQIEASYSSDSLSRIELESAIINLAFAGSDTVSTTSPTRSSTSHRELAAPRS